MSNPIPTAALDDRLGFLGTSGSGKTYNAGVAVERLLTKKARVVIVDPLGVWWGLRLTADGKHASSFDVAIFGGPRGDLPLTEHAGALIGETAATMVESCIIDLRELGSKSAERRFMTAFLDTLYRKASGEPFHLVVDEADLFAPQKPAGGDETLLGHMENIVRRGRVKGFIPWLISQRPAVLNKNVLSQVDGLIAFKLTSSQDRDALDSWIEGQADKAQGRAIKDQLPAMEIGQGVVWLPGRGVLATAKFPQKQTFDSSRTPKRGEKLKRTAALKPLNLGALKDQLAAVEAEAKANDPKKLRAEIAGLKAENQKLEQQVQRASTTTMKPEDLVAKRRDAATIAALRKELEATMNILVKINASNFFQAGGEAIDAAAVEKAIGAATQQAVKMIEANLEKRNKELDILRREAGRVIGKLKTILEQDVTVDVDVKHNQPFTVAIAQKPPAPKGNGDASGDDRPLGAERKPLAALAAVHPAGMTEAQWAVSSGLKRTGGTWSAYVSRLKMAGRFTQQGDLYFITEKGLNDIGEAPASLPPPGRDLVEFWAGKINGVGPMIRRLADAYPEYLTKEQLAADLNMAASGGTFAAYLSRLRSPGLIEEDREKNVRAASQLMEGV